ncbi:hypothetical protein [Methanoculleus sp.]|uniref:hypothetical protein n=1 Tax=Methanoculleus sp. TaxID=90427 RepID=UPI0025ED0423|nr:hypothetical protein [Methanoculleus sp.]MCK9319361.1 hypothetical protein [Methanoculleus sp.]
MKEIKSKNCCDESCEEKDLRENEELCDDFCQIENELTTLIKASSDGYLQIDYEIQQSMKKLKMLINYVLSVYNLDEEERQQYEKLSSLLIKIIY